MITNTPQWASALTAIKELYPYMSKVKREEILHAIYPWLAGETEPQWRPIESAPRDGTAILVADDEGDIDIVSYDKRYPSYPWTMKDGLDAIANQAPTHWLPIPPPPGRRS